jgi:hypothetical protein
MSRKSSLRAKLDYEISRRTEFQTHASLLESALERERAKNSAPPAAAAPAAPPPPPAPPAPSKREELRALKAQNPLLAAQFAVNHAIEISNELEAERAAAARQ